MGNKKTQAVRLMLPFLLPLLLLISCGPRIIYIGDPLWEEFTSLTGPLGFSWQDDLKKAGMRPEVFPAWPGEDELEKQLAANPEIRFLFWEPRWIGQAVDFAAGNPQIISIVPVFIRPSRDLPENVRLLIIDRTAAYGDLGLFASRRLARGEEVWAFFSTLGEERAGELAGFEQTLGEAGAALYRQWIVNSEADRQNALAEASALPQKPTLVILSAGEHNPVLFQTMNLPAERVFIEPPNPLGKTAGSAGEMYFNPVPVLKEIFSESPESQKQTYPVKGSLAGLRSDK